MTDTELFDFIEENGNGDLWICRPSITGRGYRLHNTTEREARVLGYNGKTTAREAVIDAIERDNANATLDDYPEVATDELCFATQGDWVGVESERI